MLKALRYLIRLFLIISLILLVYLYYFLINPIKINSFSHQGLEIENLVIKLSESIRFQKLSFLGIEISNFILNYSLESLINFELNSLKIGDINISKTSPLLASQEAEKSNNQPFDLEKNLEHLKILREFNLDNLEINSIKIAKFDLEINELSLNLAKGNLNLSSKISLANNYIAIENFKLNINHSQKNIFLALDSLNFKNNELELLLKQCLIDLNLKQNNLTINKFHLSNSQIKSKYLSYINIEAFLEKLNLDLQLKAFLNYLDSEVFLATNLTFFKEQMTLSANNLKLNLFQKNYLELNNLTLVLKQEKEALNTLELSLISLTQLQVNLDLIKFQNQFSELEINEKLLKNIEINSSLNTSLASYLDFLEPKIEFNLSTHLNDSENLNLKINNFLLSLKSQEMLAISSLVSSINYLDHNLNIKQFQLADIKLNEDLLEILKNLAKEETVASQKEDSKSSSLLNLQEINFNLENFLLSQNKIQLKHLNLKANIAKNNYFLSIDLPEFELKDLLKDLPINSLKLSLGGNLTFDELINGDLNLNYFLDHELINLEGKAFLKENQLINNLDLFLKEHFNLKASSDLSLALSLPYLNLNYLNIKNLTSSITDLNISTISLNGNLLVTEPFNINLNTNIPKITVKRSIINDLNILSDLSLNSLDFELTHNGAKLYIEELADFFKQNFSSTSKEEAKAAEKSDLKIPAVSLKVLESQKALSLIADGFNTDIFARANLYLKDLNTEPNIYMKARVTELYLNKFGLIANLRQPASVEYIEKTKITSSELEFLSKNIKEQLNLMWQKSSQSEAIQTGLIVFADLLTEFQGSKYNLRIEGPYPRFYYKLNSLSGEEEEGVLDLLINTLAKKFGASESQTSAEETNLSLPSELFMTHKDSMMNAGLNSLLNQNMPKALQLKADIVGEQKAIGIRTKATDNLSFGITQEVGPSGTNVIQSIQYEFKQDLNFELEKIDGDNEDTKLKIKRQIRF